MLYVGGRMAAGSEVGAAVAQMRAMAAGDGRAEPTRELYMAIPPGCYCVGLRFFLGRAGRAYVAGPGEAMARILPGVYLVASFPLGDGAVREGPRS